jgi:hypothetical protein
VDAQRVGLDDREAVGEIGPAGGHGLRQQGREPRVDLHGHDAVDRRQQAQRQRAEARTDLQDDVLGADDAADRVGVVQEVLAERLGRPQVELLGQLADRGGTQQPIGLLGWSAQGNSIS